MAASGRRFDTFINDLTHCLVCSQLYRDPRTLRCSHQFCLPCLQRALSTGRRGNEYVICPMCETVTNLRRDTRLADLNKPILVNYVKEVAMATREESDSPVMSARRTCDLCVNKFAESSVYCRDCRQALCERCHRNHERVLAYAIEEHHVVPVTSHLFCDRHAGEVIAAYCRTCQRPVCALCARTTHLSHVTGDASGVAAEAREKVQQVINDEVMKESRAGQLRNVSAVMEHVKRERNDAVGKIDSALDALAKLEAKLQGAKTEVVERANSDLVSLKSYQSSISCFHAKRGEMLQLGQYLIKSASDPEVIVKSKDFPLKCISPSKPPPLPSPALPDDLGVLLKVTEALHEALEGDVVTFGSMTLREVAADEEDDVDDEEETRAAGKRVRFSAQNCTLRHSVKLDCSVSDVLIIPAAASSSPAGNHANSASSAATAAAGARVLLRTSERRRPLLVYGVDGARVAHLGHGVKGLTEPGGLAWDSPRGLYLAACSGRLLGINARGKLEMKIKLRDRKLKGVCYVVERDVYAVTDVTQHCVIIVDATRQTILRKFGGKGEGAAEFNNPCFITSYPEAGRPVLVVSDCHNHRVQVLDVYGGYLRSHGRRGSGDGELLHPWGVAIADGGRIVACDFSNSRVAMFWREGEEGEVMEEGEEGEERWQCAIPSSQLQYPTGVSLHHGIMAVTVDKEFKIYSIHST